MSDDVGVSVYRRLLGKSFVLLPKKIQVLHDLQSPTSYYGEAEVQRGTNLFSRLIASLLSLPKSGKNISLKLEFVPEKNRERWSRTFDQDKFCTVQWEKKQLLYERLSAATLVFKPEVTDQCLSLHLEKVYFLGVPLPVFLKPTVVTEETEANDQYCFSVHVSIPLVGMLVTYHGVLNV